MKRQAQAQWKANLGWKNVYAADTVGPVHLAQPSPEAADLMRFGGGHWERSECVPLLASPPVLVTGQIETG